MNACEQYLESISLSVDGLLDERELAALEEHLAVCPACAARREAFAAIQAVMPALAQTPPDTLTPAILAKLDRTETRRPARRGLLALGGLAAAVALVVLLGQGPFGQRNMDSGVPEPMLFNMESQDAPETADQSVMFGSGEAVPPEAQPEAAADDGAALMAPADVAPTADKARVYTDTVTLTAAQVPEELAAYPCTDLGDRVEVEVTVAQLNALWPVLQDAGAQSYNERKAQDSVAGETGGALQAAGEESEQALALIVVYIQPQEATP